MIADRSMTRERYHALRRIAGRIDRALAREMSNADRADSPAFVRAEVERAAAAARAEVPATHGDGAWCGTFRRNDVLLRIARRKAVAGAMRQIDEINAEVGAC